MKAITASESNVSRVPYTMPLPDGRTIFVSIPGHMVQYDRDGEMMFTPEGGRFLDQIRALAMDVPDVPTPGYIRTLREALHLTQDQLARQVGRATVSVKKWEAGDARPSGDALVKLKKLVAKATRQGVLLAS